MPTTNVFEYFRNLNVFVKNKKRFSKAQGCRGDAQPPPPDPQEDPEVLWETLQPSFGV